jgi:hypothetical protein
MFGAESPTERLSSPLARKRSPGCRAEFPGQGTHGRVGGADYLNPSRSAGG